PGSEEAAGVPRLAPGLAALALRCRRLTIGLTFRPLRTLKGHEKTPAPPRAPAGRRLLDHPQPGLLGRAPLAAGRNPAERAVFRGAQRVQRLREDLRDAGLSLQPGGGCGAVAGDVPDGSRPGEGSRRPTLRE